VREPPLLESSQAALSGRKIRVINQYSLTTGVICEPRKNGGLSLHSRLLAVCDSRPLFEVPNPVISEKGWLEC